MMFVVMLTEDFTNWNDHGNVGGNGEKSIVGRSCKDEHVRSLMHEAEDGCIHVGAKGKTEKNGS